MCSFNGPRNTKDIEKGGKTTKQVSCWPQISAAHIAARLLFKITPLMGRLQIIMLQIGARPVKLRGRDFDAEKGLF